MRNCKAQLRLLPVLTTVQLGCEIALVGYKMTALLCGKDLAQLGRAGVVKSMLGRLYLRVDVDDDDRLYADTLLAGREVPGKMCRKCFSGYMTGSPSSTRPFMTMSLELLKAN